MVYYCSDFYFFYPLRSTSQEENLSGNKACEIWTTMLGVKMHINIMYIMTDFLRNLSEQHYNNPTNQSTLCGWIASPKFHSWKKIQTLILGYRTLIICAKILARVKNTMLWPYAIKSFVEQLNKNKVDDGGVTPIDNFSDTTTYITLKKHHTWGCPVYVLDSRL